MKGQNQEAIVDAFLRDRSLEQISSEFETGSQEVERILREHLRVTRTKLDGMRDEIISLAMSV